MPSASDSFVLIDVDGRLATLETIRLDRLVVLVEGRFPRASSSSFSSSSSLLMYPTPLVESLQSLHVDGQLDTRFGSVLILSCELPKPLLLFLSCSSICASRVLGGSISR